MLNNIEDVIKEFNSKPISKILLNLNNKKYGQEFVSLLKNALKKNKINDIKLNHLIEKSIIKEAKISYNEITNKSKTNILYANQIFMPSALAYVLNKKKIFSKEEIKKIPFNPKNTINSYIKQYGKSNLISDIKDYILNY